MVAQNRSFLCYQNSYIFGAVYLRDNFTHFGFFKNEFCGV